MREAFAACDLGTSRMRVGVMLPGGKLEVLSSLPNRVERGAGGSARCKFSTQWRAVDRLLDALGAWCQQHRIRKLHLGLCGHVSSLLPWDEAAARPLEDSYPIWLDTTCAPAMPRLNELWDNDGARRLLGTAMRPNTNWLAGKILHAGKDHPDGVLVQLADAVFHRLSGELLSHPSAQISLVDHSRQVYSAGMLAALGLSPERLPRISGDANAPMLPRVAAAHGLPSTVVYAGLMDTAASLMGLLPRPGDGILLAGTSEIVGLMTDEADPEPPHALVRLHLGHGWGLYGSATSGGSTLDWLARSILGRSPAAIARLRLAAAEIPAGSDGVRCLPWPNGERAPFWSSALSASFSRLHGHHRDAHLWRAAIEGMAYTRRLAIEALNRPMPPRFLAAGGGTADPLANRIRASVMNRPFVVYPEAEPALVGVLRHCTRIARKPDPSPKALGEAQIVKPDPAWFKVYDDGYAVFRKSLKSSPEFPCPMP